MNIMKELIKRIPRDKYKITHWNESLIRMYKFISFLNVYVVKIENHLGSSTGWTKYENEGLKLIIKGGVYRGVEWLDSIQFGEKLDNEWNNYVNPFYLYNILNNDGRRFFLGYYHLDIEKIIIEDENKIKSITNKLKKAKHNKKLISKHIETLQSDLLIK